jgi:hypothetical protein
VVRRAALGWATPRLRHPALADRWTWMVLAAYPQLRLARQLPADARLLWERPRPPGKPSPYRVRWGFGACCPHSVAGAGLSTVMVG